MKIERFLNHEDLSLAAAGLVTSRARAKAAAGGPFCLALCGGTSPQRLFSLLSRPPFSQGMPWEKVFIFWGDERLVPLDHPESNFGAAKRLLLDQAPIKPQNIFPMPVDLEPREAAAKYQGQLADFFGRENPPCLDLALLGLGPDGHTASLFPGSPSLAPGGDWVAAVPAPKHIGPALPRLTLTPAIFNAAREALFLVSGQGKHDIVNQVLFSPGRVDRPLPAETIRPKGELTWFLGGEAAGL